MRGQTLGLIGFGNIARTLAPKALGFGTVSYTHLDVYKRQVIKLFQAAKARARQIAETLLRQGMFRKGGNWSQAAGELLDTKRWQSHAQMISHEDASDPKIGLTVTYLPPASDEWQAYWQLYCLQRLAVGDKQKLFESDYASLIMEGSSI